MTSETTNNATNERKSFKKTIKYEEKVEKL